MNKEIRQFSSQFKADNRTVEGYACCFETPSENIGWIEVIHRGAITNDTIKESDVLAKFNHNNEKVLARCKNGDGSLLLEVDENGLRYMFEAPHTALGDELLEYLQRGDITNSSFAFSINPNDTTAQKWHKEGEMFYRDIYKIEKLYDVSPVFKPAYENTTCSARFAEIKAQSDEIDAKMNLLKEEIEKL